MITPINFYLLNDFSQVWGRQGYKYIVVPYWVSREAIDATLPAHLPESINRFRVEGTEHHLVGSAEQSFYQMMLDGKLPHGKYQAITPCFRDEPVLDKYHQQHFIKLELIEVGNEVCHQDMLEKAERIFWSYANLDDSKAIKDVLKIVNVSDTQDDIYMNGVEIGSYGVREVNGFRWAFGTGLAEPRFSTVLTEMLADLGHIKHIE